MINITQMNITDDINIILLLYKWEYRETSALQY